MAAVVAARCLPLWRGGEGATVAGAVVVEGAAAVATMVAAVVMVAGAAVTAVEGSRGGGWPQ